MRDRDAPRETVTLGPGVALSIRAAAAHAHPHEACGLLLGRARHIRAATRAANLAADPRRRFELDPAHHLAEQRAARARGEAVLGCWHSHPTGPPVPSAADAQGAVQPGWWWLIVAGGTIGLWEWTGGRFRPLAVAGDGDDG